MNECAARCFRLSESEYVIFFAGTDKVRLVVGRGPEICRAHEGSAVVGNFCDEGIGAAALIGGAVSVGSGGKVCGICASANYQIVFVVGVDRVEAPPPPPPNT